MSRQLKLLQAGESVVRRVPRSVLKAVSTTIGVASRAYARGGRRQAAIHQQRVTPGLHGWKLERRVDGSTPGTQRTGWRAFGCRTSAVNKSTTPSPCTVTSMSRLVLRPAMESYLPCPISVVGSGRGVGLLTKALTLWRSQSGSVMKRCIVISPICGPRLALLSSNSTRRQGPKCWRPCAPMRWCASSQIAICRAGE